MKYFRLLLIVALITLLIPISFSFDFFSPEMQAFYATNSTNLTLQGADVLLYDNDTSQMFFGHGNTDNMSRVFEYRVTCKQASCPKEIKFDTFWEYEMPAGKRMAAKMFVLTNNSPLGTYKYEFSLCDNVTKKVISCQPIEVTVISKNFWAQFWYNLWNFVVFWD